MGKGSKMTLKAASRIQSHADKTGRNQDFKGRAQRAAGKNKNKILMNPLFFKSRV